MAGEIDLGDVHIVGDLIVLGGAGQPAVIGAGRRLTIGSQISKPEPIEISILPGIPPGVWYFDSGAYFDDGLYFDTPPGIIPEVRVSQVEVLGFAVRGVTLPPYRPEQRRRQPEPPAERAEVQVVSLPTDWRETVSLALTSGQATREQIVQWLLELSQEPPTLEFIKALGEDFERNGHKFENMAAFGRKHGIQSRTTLNSYLRDYEAATGRQVRPGQGRAKRRKGK